ncbi:MAG: hypothetical protein ACI959_002194, partial [Limisphaerales bacterium]
ATHSYYLRIPAIEEPIRATTARNILARNVVIPALTIFTVAAVGATSTSNHGGGVESAVL